MFGQRLLRSVVCAIGFLAMSLHPIGTAQAVSGAISIRVLGGDGKALSGAVVKVYLLPFDAPDRFTPAALAGGTADASGVFRGAVDLAAVRGMLASTRVGGTTFNALVVAVDAAHRWRGERFAVLSTQGSRVLRIRASQDLSATPEMASWSTQELLAEGPILSRSGCPLNQCRPDVIRYPVVFTNNAAGGTESSMTYTYSSADSHQTSTSVTFTNNGITWSLGGQSEEVQSRTASQGPITHVGPYHYYWLAEYTFREYCNAPRGGCISWWWAPLKWNGQLYEGWHNATPPVNIYARVFVGPYARSAGQSQTYASSFQCCIPGAQIANTSKAQYGDITSMSWRKTSASSCARPRTIWIYGSEDYWNLSREVFVNCTF